MKERSYRSNMHKSVMHRTIEYDVVCAQNAPNIHVKKAKIVFCKEETNVKIEEDSDKTKIFYGVWSIHLGVVYNKNNKDFKYVIPTQDEVDWDEQVKLVYQGLAGSKKSENPNESSEKINKIKDALQLINEMRSRKNSK